LASSAKKRDYSHVGTKKDFFISLVEDADNWDLFQQPDADGKSPLMVLLASITLNCKKFLDENDNLVEYYANESVSINDDVCPLQYLIRIGRVDSHFYNFYLNYTTTRITSRDTKQPGAPTMLHTLVKQDISLKTLDKFIKVVQGVVGHDKTVEYLNARLEPSQDEMTDDNQGKTALILRKYLQSTVSYAI
jgi:hypothetical protein